MAHHSSEPMGDKFGQFLETEAQRMGLGATGRTPQGQVHQSDEGEIMLGVAHDPQHQKVFLNFGKPVAWLGLDPEQARELGETLIQHSWKVRGIQPEGQ